ncbi:M6 family metalloprotease domain protein [Aeromicrobium marinum DSM 15272]|uniref:M6 family metalloprotease domain protein n=1 Tax=Aeromicrobium marinum DSM 15272 TaxID=585531 RepID=E2SAG0_9ACTN|nr:immune inhibitor A domain-containing protein [Aeromicrobium marinum]EFQ84234.1 M6 family metalloprotease domain protein [Aeromicrobium marinum DSM 15272]
MLRVISGLAGLGLVVSLGLTQASASTPVSGPPTTAAGDRDQHDLPHPLEDKRQALREAAVAAVVSGDARPEQRGGSTVVKVGEAARPADAALSANENAPRAQRSRAAGARRVDQYVELTQERADKVFVILAEFGDERHPDFPDGDTDPGTAGPERFDGPLHDTIAEPDRSVNNSTVWQPSYDRAHYEQLYFGTDRESVKTYYEKQSSGRYTIDGQVSDWVKVPFNTARYGREDATTWNLIADAVEVWLADQQAAGRTPEQIAADLAAYDVYDRYDFDGDGVFEEPDGYIDHFQIVHAGPGEEDGDPSYGEDAIWSHRWYAFLTDAGLTGPADNRLGGTQIGDTGLWIGDYTVQPENGGLSVFVHEYGHDLGLPDAYDTSGGGDNSNEYWTLMAQSRLGAEGEALGERAGDLGAWEKLQLGWLDYAVVQPKDSQILELGPQQYNTDKPQAAVMPLPAKEVTRDNGAPATGELQFFSGSGDDLANAMSTSVDLTAASSATLTARIRYEIEVGYDYAYVQASTDGGATWTALDGTIDGQPIGLDTSGRPGIDGEQASWADLVVPLDAYAGQQVDLRVHYKTDGGLALPGLFLDDVTVSADGEPVLTDGAETGGEAWVLDGFEIVGATSTEEFDHFYIAGNRTYVDYDQYLRTGPYNFGFADTRPDWVEHYAYQQGLLISYWDTSVADNNTSQHPGTGRNLIIDSRPEPIVNQATGAPWRARIQVYDAPFSTKGADSMTLHTNGVPSLIRGEAPEQLFDDTDPYWFAALPNHGVKLPGVGVKIRVLQERGTSVRVRFY